MGITRIGNYVDIASVFGTATLTLITPGQYQLDLLTGANFALDWVGSTIMVEGVSFQVHQYNSSSQLILYINSSVSNGNYNWEFNYTPASQSDLLTIFDRKVNYSGRASFGTGNLNHTTFTWVSGSKFTDYWAGQNIFINGVQYTILTATPTVITLTTDSGLVTSGLSYNTIAGSWYYSSGIETLSLATLIARTFTSFDDGYQVYVYDYGHTLIYNGSSGLWSSMDDGSNYQVLGNGGPPSGGIWAPCNGGGTTVFELVSGVPTAASITTPNNSGYYLRR